MPKKQPQTLKGFRDFLPAEKKLRDHVSRNIIKTFESFGFEPIETPTLEYASVLLGKYGDEADKLVYTFKDKGNRKIGLRYDQTVPTARLLTQYGPQLPKFFRRYQIQNVFRADKPQKADTESSPNAISTSLAPQTPSPTQKPLPAHIFPSKT